MDKSQKPTYNLPTLKDDLRGLELGEETRIWKEVASSEARMAMMKSMIKEDLAFADLEEFGAEFTNKLKAIKAKNKTMYRRVSKPAMKAKLADEQAWRRDLGRVRAQMRKDLVEKLGGEKVRRWRRVINHLNKLAKTTKEKLNEKYNNKIQHLKQKYRNENEENEDEEVPSDLTDFSDLTIFQKARYEEIETQKYDVKTIGDVVLSDDEKKVLQLHNKFSILETLKPSSMNVKIEASLAKLRMEKEKDDLYKDFTVEERSKDEELEARNRMIFDPTEGIFDNRKRRVTDLRQCARVTLPKSLSPDEESKLEVRKRSQIETFEHYRKNNTNKNGEQRSNLSHDEKTGLRSLQKRIKNEEIIIMKTDKSGRFVVTTPEKYKELGKEHTEKDTEISWGQVKELERRVNQHTIAWELIWRTGEDHNHQERIMRSKATRSGNQANLNLLYKDHKEGDKTRPVATGNESYNQGLSNGLSDVMESVARVIRKPYSVISCEDLLARVSRYNNSNNLSVPTDGQSNISASTSEQSTTSPPLIGEHQAPTISPIDPEMESPKPPLIGGEEDLVTAVNTSLPSEKQISNMIGQENNLPAATTEQGIPSPLLIGGEQVSNMIGQEYNLPVNPEKQGTPLPPLVDEHQVLIGGGDEDLVTKLSLIGSDVVALFPSITADRTAEIVRKKIEESEIEFEGIDIDKARAYLAINIDDMNDEVKERIKHVIPERKSKNGTRPTMASINSKWEPKNQWEVTEIEINDIEKKQIIGAVVEIALKVLFKNFTYKFGGTFFRQNSGGPIGVRATGAAAQLVMEDWALKYQDILKRSGLTTFLLAGYVDDGRQVTSTLCPGMRFGTESNKFEFSGEALKEDIEKQISGETANQRMSRVCVSAMNSINPDLKFTTECQEDFPDGKLPTLDCAIWIDEDNVIHHTYFQKSMKTPFVIMERSGMSYHQKFQILSNELVRRLSNVKIETIPHHEVIQIIEQFINELKTSGYSLKQARELVCSGIRGWRSKHEKRKQKNIPFYRLAEHTVESRLRKDLLEKETWYKNDNKDDDAEDQAVKKIHTSKTPSSRPTAWKRKGKRLKRLGGEKAQIKSVLFIPHTANSELATVLRDRENKLYETTGEKVKIVERAGKRLEDLLTKGDPWKGSDCQRPNCFICTTKIITGRDKNKDCTRRNINYEIKCLTCENEDLARIEEEAGDNLELKKQLEEKMQTPIYVGETSRSGYERGFEHLDMLATLSSNSVMLRHMLLKHGERDMSEIKWGMRITSYNRTAFERQLEEAVKIERTSKSNVNILNSRSEWASSALPRLVTRQGKIEDEIKSFEKELREEKLRDDEFEEKVRELRKNRNKARLIKEKNPPSKRQKLDENKYITIRKTWGPPPNSAPRKNTYEKLENENKQNKKPRIENEIIKNIRTIENKIIEGETIRNFEIIETSKEEWENHINEHKKKLEEEQEEREKRIEKKNMREKSYQLLRECRKYLEENEKEWEKKKFEREKEIKKQERLAKAKFEQEKLRNKVRERNLKIEIKTKMDELPKNEKRKIENEEEKKKNLELAEAKKNLWKLRKREKHYERKSEKVEQLERIENLEEKLNMIDKLAQKLQEEEEKFEEEKRKRKEKSLEEWRKKVKEKDKREKDKKERLEKQRLLGQRWAMKRWVTEFIRENEKNWELEKKEREKQYKLEIENWEKLKRKEKIKRLQEKWRKKDDYQEQKEEKIQSSENQNKEIWTWRKREREEGENDAELGGGGSPVAFPIPKKAPSSLKMEGDPPLGKERGALGVGTGPTPLPKRPFPPKDVIKRPKIVLEEQNISKIISNMPSVGKIITTATRVKNLTITTVSSEGQKATITKKKLRQVAKVSTDRKKHEVPSNQNIITTINKLDTKSISTANTEGQMAKITANIKPSNITKASDGEKMKKISIRNQDSKPQIENDYVIPEQQNTKVKTTLRPPQKEDNPKPKRNYNKGKQKRKLKTTH